MLCEIGRFRELYCNHIKLLSGSVDERACLQIQISVKKPQNKKNRTWYHKYPPISINKKLQIRKITIHLYHGKLINQQQLTIEQRQAKPLFRFQRLPHMRSWLSSIEYNLWIAASAFTIKLFHDLMDRLGNTDFGGKNIMMKLWQIRLKT